MGFIFNILYLNVRFSYFEEKKLYSNFLFLNKSHQFFMKKKREEFLIELFSS